MLIVWLLAENSVHAMDMQNPKLTVVLAVEYVQNTQVLYFSFHMDKQKENLWVKVHYRN